MQDTTTRPVIAMRKYLAQTTYTENGVEQTGNLNDAHLGIKEARELAGRYLLTLLAGTARSGPAQVQAVGRNGWKVTLADGTTETIDIVPVG